jgi:hypothetical protein
LCRNPGTRNDRSFVEGLDTECMSLVWICPGTPTSMEQLPVCAFTNQVPGLVDGV